MIIDVQYLYLVGKIYDPLESVARSTSLNLYSNFIVIAMNAELQSDKMFLYSNNTIKLASGSKL